MMELKDVVYSLSDHVATITLNRPDQMNTLGGTLGEDLDAAFRQAEKDKEVRCVILTGAGKAFCAGLDMKERSRDGGQKWINRLRGLETPRIILNMTKPIIAAINGPAVGWGFEIAMLCDYRFGSGLTRMGDVHVKRGLIQDALSPLTLPRSVGWSTAVRVLLTGEIIEAEELLRLGLIDELVEPNGLIEAATIFAQRITCNAPVAVQMSKRLMRMANPADVDAIADYSMLLMGVLQQSEDFKEGLTAFLEKRLPEFNGQ